jgi:hypothetical protein
MERVPNHRSEHSKDDIALELLQRAVVQGDQEPGSGCCTAILAVPARFPDDSRQGHG